jgi:hypothetical protein
MDSVYLKDYDDVDNCYCLRLPAFSVSKQAECEKIIKTGFVSFLGDNKDKIACLYLAGR